MEPGLVERLKSDQSDAWTRYYQLQEESEQLSQRLSILKAEQARLQGVYLYLGNILQSIEEGVEVHRSASIAPVS